MEAPALRDLVCIQVGMVDQSTHGPQWVRRMETSVFGLIGWPEEDGFERKRETVEPSSLLQMHMAEQLRVFLGQPAQDGRRAPVHRPIRVEATNEGHEFDIVRRETGELKVYHCRQVSGFDQDIR